MSITPLVSLAASDASGGINPWVVGVSVFVLLLACSAACSPSAAAATTPDLDDDDDA